MTPTKIKFCGLTRVEDVRFAAQLPQVGLLGFVFALGSPRRLSLSLVSGLRAAVPADRGVVALFKDNTSAQVAQIVRELRPDILQFHGGEDDAYCASFGIPFFKVIAMGGEAIDASEAAEKFPSAAAFLLDGHAPGASGGSGQSFDWRRIPALRKPFLVAGGLRPDNVRQAVLAARPWGVDVSSGIESAPGIKDADKMRRFVEEVQRADRDQTPQHD